MIRRDEALVDDCKVQISDTGASAGTIKVKGRCVRWLWTQAWGLTTNPMLHNDGLWADVYEQVSRARNALPGAKGVPQ